MMDLILPEKVFVELANAWSKDLIMEHVAEIVKTGNNGCPIT